MKLETGNCNPVTYVMRAVKQRRVLDQAHIASASSMQESAFYPVPSLDSVTVLILCMANTNNIGTQMKVP